MFYFLFEYLNDYSFHSNFLSFELKFYRKVSKILDKQDFEIAPEILAILFPVPSLFPKHQSLSLPIPSRESLEGIPQIPLLP